MGTVRRAAVQVADVDLHTVDGDDAGPAAEALASPLRRLTELRQFQQEAQLEVTSYPYCNADQLGPGT